MGGGIWLSRFVFRWLDIDIQQSSKDISVTIGSSAKDCLGKAFRDLESVQFARTISRFHRLLP
jgi:hypothetical protein